MSSPRADPQTYLRALARTVPYTIVEAVLANPSEESVRSTQFPGAVLHADLVGFTASCERIAAAGPNRLGELTEALNLLFARLLEDAIFPFDGYAMQFGGDSVTAVFRGEEASLRAAAAALAVRDCVHQVGTRLIAQDPTPLLIRVGVAKGNVRLTVVGDLLQRSVLCGGPASFRAIELQQRAQPNSVMVDGPLLAELGARAAASPGGPGSGCLLELRHWPARSPIQPLDGRVETATEAKISLLEPFVPPPLLERLRTTPQGWRLDGELRQVVVLFAELCGARKLSADSLVAPVLSDISRSMLRTYRKYGGLLAKAYLAEDGHRAMVLFGLHLPSQNDPERALLAALESTARVKGFIAGSGLELTFRTGLHQGLVYFGTFGSDYRHDVTVVGDAVNTAARLASAAGPFEVLASQTLLQGVSGELLISPRPPLSVKGKSAPLSVGVVHSTREGGSHYLRTRGRTRHLAGRELTQRRLLDLTEQAFRGPGMIVGLRGEDGAGKSALLSQAVDAWTQHGAIGMLGRCRYATRTEPLAPVISMFSAFLGLARGDSEEVRRERIRSGFEQFRLGEGVSELVSLLMPVRNPGGVSESVVEMAEGHARERVLSALLRFFQQSLSQEPVLYVVEDLHFADSLTLELAHRIAALPRQHPFLFLLTYRPDPVVEEPRRTVDVEVVLENLSPPQAEELLVSELGAGSVEPRLLGFLMERTGGNPAHLVDLIRFLRDRELLRVRGGTVVQPEGGLRFLDHVVPRSAAHLALAQLDGLGEVERRLVRTASAIGKSFSRELLESVSGDELDQATVGWAIDSLEGRQLIAPETQRRYAFRDEILRATAYSTLPEERRREIHRRIADALERRPDFQPARDAALLAVHREKAAQWLEASRWYEQAAPLALRSFLHEEARHLADRFFACAAELAEADRPPPSSCLKVALTRLVALGRVRLSRETLAQANQLLEEHGSTLEPRARAAVELWRGCALSWLGELEAAREVLARVHQSAEDRLVRFEAAMQLVQSHDWSLEPEAVRAWLGQAAELAQEDEYLKARVEHFQATPWNPEELPGALEAYSRLRSRARERGRYQLCARAANSGAHCALHLRRFEEAREGFEESMRLCRALRAWADLANGLSNLGQAYLWDGQPDRARPVLEEALRTAQEAGEQLVVAEATVHLGASLALTADPTAGSSLCEEGAELARRAGLKEAVLAAHLHLYRLALERQDSTQAKRWGERCREDAPEYKTPLLCEAYRQLVERERRSR